MGHHLLTAAAAFGLAAVPALVPQPAVAAVRELNEEPAPGESFANDPVLIQIHLDGTVHVGLTSPGHDAVPMPALWLDGGQALNVPATGRPQ